MKTNIVLVITAIVIFFCFLVEYDKKASEMTYVKSNINGEMYRVRKLDDKIEASDILAETEIKLRNICNFLKKKFPDDDRVKRLDRFDNTIIQESDGNGNQTSYSINKGEKLVLCLRAKDGTNSFVDKNVLLFVSLHEITHIMTKSVGHTEEFWDNFKFVLKECQEAGLYKCIDFSKNPQKYCGIKVSNTPQPCF